MLRSPRWALSALTAALLALALLPFSPPPASAAPTIVGVALDAQGKPLRNIGWTVHRKVGATWEEPQFGPRVTDANGRFSYNVVAGGVYRVCFSDDYYGDPTYGSVWLPEERHRDTCWSSQGGSSSVTTAESWTAAGAGKTFTVRMPDAGLGQAPVEPFMTGTFAVGQPIILVGQEGWRPTNAALTYQWYLNGVLVPAATGASYTPVATDAGKWINAVVTGTRAGYKTARMYSQSTKVGGTHASLTRGLEIGGTAAPGRTLTATFGKPSAANHTMLEWFVDGVSQGEAIQNAQTSTFAVTPAMAGARVEARLSVYLTNAQGYIDGSDTYRRAAVQVSGARPAQALAVTAPAVSRTPVAGAPAVGATLTAPRPTADPSATTTYQWLRGAAPIAGATASTYALKSVDMGQRMAVAVTVSRPGWWSTYVGTSRTSDVVRGVLPAGKVKIKGAARVGAKLTAKVAGWKGVKLTYRWLRNGKAIKPAKKAKKATYKVTRKDRGKKITVVVTATKASHLPATTTAKVRKIKR